LKIHTEIRVQKTSEIEQTSAAPTSCEAEHKDDKLAGINVHCTLYRAGIFKPLWSPGIDAKASIPPAYVAWRAGTITLFLLGA
jgi:hypothetical protein